MAPLVTVTRFAYTSMGVFGRLALPMTAEIEGFECYTVERPWLDNRPRESCIPKGTYAMQLGTYHRGGYPAWELLRVPGRQLIKIHRANTMDDLLGCIGLGKDLGHVAGKWGVVRSREAYDEWMVASARLGDRATIVIQNAYDLA
jgi:hypothetical protein